MKSKDNIEIHETAFVTSSFRAWDDQLSKDTFARLWHNTKTEQWIADYLSQVSSEEPFTHCLRNRYFLDTIKGLMHENEIETLINFGSGFSMYPFLLEDGLINIEIDKPEIIHFKQSKVEQWQRENRLPRRNIHFIGVDFSKKYSEDLRSKINAIKGNKSSFILIEGVLFFLNRPETNLLFDFFSTIQGGGDYIGSASFVNVVRKTTAFERLMQFFSQSVATSTYNDYQTVSHDYYNTRDGYDLLDQQDYYSLSQRYGHEVKSDPDLILNESFYLLRKR